MACKARFHWHVDIGLLSKVSNKNHFKPYCLNQIVYKLPLANGNELV